MRIGANVLGTLLPCYLVTLVPWYPVTLVPCYPGTLVPYPITLLPYPITLLPCYRVTLVPWYPGTLTHAYTIVSPWRHRVCRDEKAEPMHSIEMHYVTSTTSPPLRHLRSNHMNVRFEPDNTHLNGTDPTNPTNPTNPTPPKKKFQKIYTGDAC